MLIRVVQRALKVLECFERDRPRLSLHEISLRIALPKSTVFRLLATLIGEGYLVQVDKQEYALSHKLMRLGSVAQHSLGLRDIVHPVLERLARETGETVEVSMLDGDARICVDVVESSSSLKSMVSVGDRLPLVYGAAGKTFLAHMADATVKRILEEAGQSQSAFERQLRKIRAQGFATTHSERLIGATAISVPLRDHRDGIFYCLTATGPSNRFNSREDAIRNLVLAAGAEISTLLGGGSAQQGMGRVLAAQGGV